MNRRNMLKIAAVAPSRSGAGDDCRHPEVHGDGRQGRRYIEATVELEKMLDAEGKASLDELKNASGREFDAATLPRSSTDTRSC
ncbi:DUF4142 domain-containing protein [Rhizobium leguminosarum]|uniref:DUF4142 domain-containing protein n=1 Tax=Rhizobium leguminosarum TaxID=384 RepID=UPI0021B0A9D0|nr:DUF4142 domain-containing protein [Rhizobium leguminosarum]